MPDVVTKEEAHRLVVENSWEEDSEETCGHPGCREHRETNRRIHTFAGSFGCDWDLELAEREIEAASEIRWVPHMLRHELAVMCADGKPVYFDVQRPRTVADVA